MRVDNLTVNDTLAVSGTLKLLPGGKLDVLPAGIIVAWGKATPPPGWAYCNGKNGTPDLRNRFILAPGNRGIGNKGGTETVTLTADQIPKHQHDTKLGVNPNTPSRMPCFNCRTTKYKGSYGDSGPDSLEGNEKIIDTSYVGGGKPHSNMPPYYVLSYIMKL